MHRRDFTLAALAAPFVCTSAIRGEDTPSKKINLGFIGVGKMGRDHLGPFLGMKDVQIIAVSDVVVERRDNAKRIVDDFYSKKDKASKGDCKTFDDFRDLLALKDVDAVVIATPDHWHAIPCVLAAKAKKDIYCEKPLTHAIAHGRKVVEAVKANKVIFQTGSQQRSEFGGDFHKAASYVRNGRIGKVHTVVIGVGGPAVECKLPTQEVPKGTDWDRWLGPAPVRGYHSDLCPKGNHNHFPAWRNYKEYAGGGLSDMGAHHFDIAQWALGMDASGPVKIEPPMAGQVNPQEVKGLVELWGKLPEKERAKALVELTRGMPAKDRALIEAYFKDDSGLRFTYANGIVMVHGGPSGCTFIGSEGLIYVDRGKLQSFPDTVLKTPLGEKDAKLYRSENHKRNWIECIKNRKETICPAEVGHRTSTVCQLANIGYWLRRKLTWDPAKERFVDDKDANKLVDRELRGDWKLG